MDKPRFARHHSLPSFRLLNGHSEPPLRLVRNLARRNRGLYIDTELVATTAGLSPVRSVLGLTVDAAASGRGMREALPRGRPVPPLHPRRWGSGTKASRRGREETTEEDPIGRLS